MTTAASVKEPLRRDMSLPLGLTANHHLAKSCLDLKPPIGPPRKPGLNSRSNSSLSLKAGGGSRRGSVDLPDPSLGLGAKSKIPIWSGSQERIHSPAKNSGPMSLGGLVPTQYQSPLGGHQNQSLSGKPPHRTFGANQRRKWESCSNLEVRTFPHSHCKKPHSKIHYDQSFKLMELCSGKKLYLVTTATLVDLEMIF